MSTVTVKEDHPCRRELLIEVSPEVMEEELSSVYVNIGLGVRIPGFRPGKAPRRVLEKHFGADARAQTIESQLQKAYEEAIPEQEFRVLGNPEISDVDWPEGGPLSFKALVEISPPVKLQEYRGLKLKKKINPVEESDIDQVIDDLRERKAEYLTESPRAAVAGDWSLVDYLPPGRKDEEWVEGALLEISEDRERGIGAQLIGLEPGQSREVTLPDSAEESGEAAPQVFPVRMQEIKKRVLPEANDEWARLWGEYADLEELRKQIGEDMARSRDLRARRELEEQAGELLLQGYDFPLPPSALENLIESRLENYRRRSGQSSEESAATPDEKVIAGARQESEKELRLIFILREIARAEKLEVDPRALGEEIAGLARREGVPPAQLRKVLEERGQIPILQDQLLRGRVLEFVIEQAQIKGQQGDK